MEITWFFGNAEHNGRPTIVVCTRRDSYPSSVFSHGVQRLDIPPSGALASKWNRISPHKARRLEHRGLPEGRVPWTAGACYCAVRTRKFELGSYSQPNTLSRPD